MRGEVKVNEAEELFWLHCRATHLRPLPERQYAWAENIGRKFLADFAWPEQRVLVELDGGVHRIAPRFQASMERDNLAVALGWKQLKFSRRDVTSGKAIDAVTALLANGDLVGVLQRRIACVHRTQRNARRPTPPLPSSPALPLRRFSYSPRS